jgi:hypothetical protein
MGSVVDDRCVDARSGGYGTTYTDREPSSNTPASKPSFLGEVGDGPDSFGRLITLAASGRGTRDIRNRARARDTI